MSIQTSYLTPESQWLDLSGKVLILRQNSGAIAITTGTGYGWGPTNDGYGFGRAQHGGVGTGYNEYMLLDRADYDLVYQYIYFDAGITFFEDFLKTTEFIFSQDLNGDGEIPDTTIDRAFHYQFNGSDLQKSGSLTIEFSQAPSSLQLVFERLDENGDRVGGMAPSIDSSSFVSGKTTKIDTGLLKGSYDGINNILKLNFNWAEFYGTDYKNVIGQGGVMVSIAAGSDTLSDGAVFATAMYGTNAVDDIYGSTQGEEIFALNGNDDVESGLGDDWVDGGKGNDHLDGGDGDDNLIGGTGNDTMIGGIGDDTFTVDSSGDVVLENIDEGVDTVNSYISYSLINTYLENLTLLGTKALNATGNSEANVLRGNSAANVLDGQGGADTLEGGTGNDTYIVYGDGETITDTAGTDLIRSYATWTLSAGLENLTLMGSDNIDGVGNTGSNNITGNSANNVLSGDAGNDALVGGAGNDMLDGGTGADRMTGGTGDDVYVVDNAKDTVTEKVNEGTDTIETTLTSLSIAKLSAIENLTYTGLSNAILVGNASVNTLTGNSGTDRLDGGIGGDSLIGGDGSDVYIVDDFNDTIIEAPNEGTDSVLSSVTFTLFDNVENLTLTGKAAINGTGNALDNVIRGNAAANWLFGGAGTDTIYGEAGNDWLSGFLDYEDSDLDDLDFVNLVGSQELIVDHLYGGKGNDVYLLDGLVGTPIIYENLNEGIDTVLGDWEAYTLTNNVENYVNDLSLTENNLPIAIIITGNNLNNILKSSPTNWNDIKSILSTINNAKDSKEEFYGLDGNDTILSGGGNDLLSGGLGNDRLTGGSGSDQFVFDTALNSKTNVDTITDFETAADRIELNDTIFTRFFDVTGQIAEGNLVKGGKGVKALDSNDHLIFNTATGALFYDADGNGAGAAIQFATLTGVSNISYTDFWIV